VGRAGVKKSLAAGIWSWVPEFILVFMIIFGFLVWVVWSYVRQMQLFGYLKPTFGTGLAHA
jgi:hypothetical protein